MISMQRGMGVWRKVLADILGKQPNKAKGKEIIHRITDVRDEKN